MASKIKFSIALLVKRGPSDMKAEGFTTILVLLCRPARRAGLDDRRRVFRRQKATPVISGSFCGVKPARIFAPPKLPPYTVATNADFLIYRTG
jgi:hypothetical protein